MNTTTRLATLLAVLALAPAGCETAEQPPAARSQPKSPPADPDAGQEDDDELDLKIFSKAFGQQSQKPAPPSK